MVITADAALEARLATALSDAHPFRFHTEFVRDLAHGLDRIEASAPDVLVLDLKGEPAAGPRWVPTALERAAEVPLVALAQSPTLQLAQYLIQQGAQECLDRQGATPAELRKALVCAAERRAPDSLKRRRMHEFKTGEARFWELLAAYPEGQALLSKDGTVRLINAAACKLLGRESAELVGRPFPFALAPGERRVVQVVRGDGDAAVVEIRRVETEWEWETASVAVVRDVTEQTRTSERLKSSEERYRLATRATTDAVYDWNMVSGEVIWSEAFGWSFGYPFSEIAANVDWWFERVHEDDRARVATVLEDLHKGTTSAFEVEYRFKRRDGSFATVLDRGHVVRDREGRGLRTVGVMSDITARRRAEEELRASEKLLARAEGIAHVGSFEWDLKTGSAAWSAEMYRIYGVDREGFVPSMQSTRVFVHPEDLERVSREGRAAIEAGEPFRIVYRINRADGAARVVYAAGVPTPGENGRTIGYTGIVQDITERWRAEEALKESEARLAEAQQVAGIGTWQWDAATNRVTTSPELWQLLGARPGEINPNLEAFIERAHPDDRPLARRIVEEAFARRTPFEAEVRVVRMDGEVRRIFSRADFVVGESGSVLRLVGIVLDITDRWPGGPDAARSAPAREFVPAPREAIRVRAGDARW